MDGRFETNDRLIGNCRLVHSVHAHDGPASQDHAWYPRKGQLSVTPSKSQRRVRTVLVCSALVESITVATAGNTKITRIVRMQHEHGSNQTIQLLCRLDVPRNLQDYIVITTEGSTIETKLLYHNCNYTFRSSLPRKHLAMLCYAIYPNMIDHTKKRNVCI